MSELYSPYIKHLGKLIEQNKDVKKTELVLHKASQRIYSFCSERLHNVAAAKPRVVNPNPI